MPLTCLFQGFFLNLGTSLSWVSTHREAWNDREVIPLGDLRPPWINAQDPTLMRNNSVGSQRHQGLVAQGSSTHFVLTSSLLRHTLSVPSPAFPGVPSGIKYVHPYPWSQAPLSEKLQQGHKAIVPSPVYLLQDTLTDLSAKLP